MLIRRISCYRDGGSLQIQTNEGDFVLDKRYESKTRNKLFYGYPNRDESNLVDSKTEKQLKEKFKTSLKDKPLDDNSRSLLLEFCYY